jgi:hypothetical protein
MLIGLVAGKSPAADLADSLQALRAVGPKGAGNEAAALAWQQAARVDASRIPELLAALDGANPLAANWIRTAIDSLCERAVRDEGALPKEAFERFVLEASHDPKGRRLAYEWLLKVDAAAEDRIVPQLLDDPSTELRRDAVARLIEQAEKAVADGNKDEAVKLFEKAFDAARDRDQVNLLAGQLKKLGREVDLVAHDGLIVDWLVIGPFDNTGEAGFGRVYPPEEKYDPNGRYHGKNGEVAWLKYRSGDPGGKTDLYDALKGSLVRISEKLQEREVVAYAVAEFRSAAEQKVQIRASTTNAIKIWVNGDVAGEHNVYHAGSPFDQYRADVVLKAGSNRIMVKVCQNAQTQDWTEDLGFYLRVCDAIGGGILSAKQE